MVIPTFCKSRKQDQATNTQDSTVPLPTSKPELQNSAPDTNALDIAVIGSGIAGLSAAWLLSQRHKVTVYEQNDYIGGHSHTTDVQFGNNKVAVDTGFIVYNPVNYPNLVALFDHLNVPTKPSNMSFAASLDDGKLEYSGTSLKGLFAQRRNLLRPRFYRMLNDLLRFYRKAPKLIDDETLSQIPLGEFLKRERYCDAFIHDHLLPMGGAIWSSSAEQMLSFPTLGFLRFFKNHGLVQLNDRPHWRTVDGGSREYVKRLIAGFEDRVHYGDPIVNIDRGNQGVELQTTSGNRVRHDHVILACHSDQALALLNRPTTAEDKLLSSIRYQNNRAVLHTDLNLMPDNQEAWASWNYIGSRDDANKQLLCVTYWMNLLQSLKTPDPLLITLNPSRAIDPQKVFASYDYMHPLFDAAAISAQPELWSLQGQQNTWYCGAYFGYGFHEDGIQSGLAVAEMLGGVRRPWQVANESGRINLSPDLTKSLPELNVSECGTSAKAA